MVPPPPPSGTGPYAGWSEGGEGPLVALRRSQLMKSVEVRRLVMRTHHIRKNLNHVPKFKVLGPNLFLGSYWALGVLGAYWPLGTHWPLGIHSPLGSWAVGPALVVA